MNSLTYPFFVYLGVLCSFTTVRIDLDATAAPVARLIAASGRVSKGS